MASKTEAELLAIVERFFTAYNEMDLGAFGSLLAADVRWEHHNRFQGNGRDALVTSVRAIQGKVPDRRFTEITRWAARGDTVYVEHGWSATPDVTDEAWGYEAGVATSKDIASVFVIEDELITKWSDYG
ncbi:MAG: nuclear transport factor 2 family protein [Streptosporangiaceae bacterium]